MVLRKVIWICIGILLAAFVVWFFLNKSLNSQDVKDFIQQQLPENIDLKYSELKTNVFLGEFKLKDAEVFLKNKGIRITADELKIKGIDYNNLLQTDTIAISETQIENAYVWVDNSLADSTVMIPGEERRNIFLKLDKFKVDFSGLELKDENGQVQLKMNATQLGLNNLLIQSKPSDFKNQLKYSLVKIKTDSLVLPLNTTQHVYIGALELDSAQFKLKDTQLTLRDKGIDLNFDLLQLRGDDFNHILSKDTIQFTECVLSKGEIKINNAKPQTRATRDTLKSWNKVLKIQEFKISDTDFEFIDRKGNPLLKFEDTDAFFKDLKILTAPKETENTITYTFINLNARDLKYPMNHLHTMKVKNIEVEQNLAKLKQFSIEPNFSRENFQKQIKEEQDVINLKVPEILIKNYDFSFDEVNNFFSAQFINLSQPDLNIFRDKTMPDQTPRKPMYSEMLRNLKFKLAIDEIELRKAKLTYEEKVAENQPPGKIYFTEFDAKIRNIHNKNSSRPVDIRVDTRFMGHAPTWVNWQFNIQQPYDKFQITGEVNQLDARSMDNFLVPNMKAKLDGDVLKASFNFTGNDKGLTGKMDMLYDNLKVEILDDENEKKGVVSTIANFLVKSKKDKIDNTPNHIQVERDQQKSFFNLFWLGLKEGIKQNMLKFKSKNAGAKK
ncbi:MAG: hypothetical protein Q4G27_03290 [Flavobacteriaceae bacterium]|nr:hypothetical protein [Flavobacteriaceae bacterium]